MIILAYDKYISIELFYHTEVHMLAGHELHSLWSAVDEGRRIALLDSLNDEAAEALIGYQLRRRVQGVAPPSRPEPVTPARVAVTNGVTAAVTTENTTPHGTPTTTPRVDRRTLLHSCDDPELAQRRASNRQAVARYRQRQTLELPDDLT